MKVAVLEPPPRTERATMPWQSLTIAGWASVLGFVSGLACVGVRLGFRLLQAVLVRHAGLLPQAAAQLTSAHRVAVPVLGAALATLILLGARRRSGSAPFAEYVVAVRSENGQIPFPSTAWRTLSSAFSVATGAAVGREGSMIQFATAVTSWAGGRSRFTQASLSRQVAFGAAAAVAAAYQAPLAAVFFAFEIVLGKWSWTDLPGLVCASTAGWTVSRLLLGPGPLFLMPGALPWPGVAWALPLTLLLAALGPAYQKLLHGASLLRRLPMPLIWSGLLVGLLSVAQPAVWGNGDAALLSTLTGKPTLLAMLSLLAFRLTATTACVGTGTVGGVFTPTLFTGAALGLLASHLVQAAHPLLLTLVGLSVFLAAVTHAPCMAGFMAAELTGQWHALPLLVFLNLVAVPVAKRISPQSLYGIATSAPSSKGRLEEAESQQQSSLRQTRPC